MKREILVLLYFLAVTSQELYQVKGLSLETLPDDDLLQLIRAEKFVVVLFTKKNCPECEKYETAVLNARDEIVDSLGAWVVQSKDSTLARLYSQEEPAIVFFRHGVPLLYDGVLEEDHITQNFIDNKEPIVRELTDANFEHLTQAASGATTGDWFVMFYSSSCVECQRLYARWEAVGAATRARGIVVARADRGGPAAATGRRFKVTEEPTFILFRREKMYWYDFKKYDIKSLIAFSQDWYKNAKSERVPSPTTPFDDLVNWCVYLIKDIVDLGLRILSERPWIWQIGLAGFGLVGITSIIAYVKARSHLKQS